MPSPNAQVRSKIATFIGLVVFTTAALGAFLYLLPEVEKSRVIETTAKWDNPQGASLRPGPPWFMYDRAEGSLKVSRVIDECSKRDLIDLAPQGDSTFQEAVDRLAYASQRAAHSPDATFWIILTAIIAGIIGVMIRSMTSFVFHTCEIEDLDLTLWWPWYALRPFLGASISVTLVVLLDSHILLLEGSQKSGLWLLGLCIVAGFGADEFIERLLYLSRTLFGQSKDEDATNRKREEARKMDRARQAGGDQQAALLAPRPEGEDPPAAP